ncbi:hypothetical protein [Pseudoalteromonas luteoviolacea]|uniref:hypothetical protein n=1 Tax=Pseudoalteromonas luteoviolacea TaxID=43657 RepID=UPI0012DAD127|nr:hypothetical protein [Pseudoalteromonas luteoviolacea]
MAFILSTASALASFLTIYTFIREEVYSDFWSPRWLISTGCLVVFAIATSAFMKFTGWKAVEVASRVLLSVFYSVCALAAFIVMFFSVKEESLDWSSYIGFLVLTSIFTLIAKLSSIDVPDVVKKVLSSIIGFGVMLVVYWSMEKYVFQNPVFHWNTFSKEIILLIISSVILAKSFSKGEQNTTQKQNKKSNLFNKKVTS